MSPPPPSSSRVHKTRASIIIVYIRGGVRLHASSLCSFLSLSASLSSLREPHTDNAVPRSACLSSPSNRPVLGGGDGGEGSPAKTETRACFVLTSRREHTLTEKERERETRSTQYLSRYVDPRSPSRARPRTVAKFRRAFLMTIIWYCNPNTTGTRARTSDDNGRIIVRAIVYLVGLTRFSNRALRITRTITGR